MLWRKQLLVVSNQYNTAASCARSNDRICIRELASFINQQGVKSFISLLGSLKLTSTKNNSFPRPVDLKYWSFFRESSTCVDFSINRKTSNPERPWDQFPNMTHSQRLCETQSEEHRWIFKEVKPATNLSPSMIRWLTMNFSVASEASGTAKYFSGTLTLSPSMHDDEFQPTKDAWLFLNRRFCYSNCFSS